MPKMKCLKYTILIYDFRVSCAEDPGFEASDRGPVRRQQAGGVAGGAGLSAAELGGVSLGGTLQIKRF